MAHVNVQQTRGFTPSQIDMRFNNSLYIFGFEANENEVCIVPHRLLTKRSCHLKPLILLVPQQTGLTHLGDWIVTACQNNDTQEHHGS